MSIISKTCYAVRCDRCGRLSDDEYWDNRDGAEDFALDCGWVRQDGKHYCPDCWILDDDDNIAIKPETEDL